ncbi:hypothetical protein [Nocardiopsis sp. FIRDI 009]|uniref:hypothetical protein n=1 Tax=Nocardiopsis sp. FIRDI 009 TaxID=714197 RepID=UPI000E264A60|nr:hypothetical protein [Nocardiopsis sp. FIRDI 009]
MRLKYAFLAAGAAAATFLGASPVLADADGVPAELGACRTSVASLAESLGVDPSNYEFETLEECQEAERELDAEYDEVLAEQGVDVAPPASPVPADPNYTG